MGPGWDTYPLNTLGYWVLGLDNAPPMMLPMNDAGVKLKAKKENARAWLDGSVDSESIVRTVLSEKKNISARVAEVVRRRGVNGRTSAGVL